MDHFYTCEQCRGEATLCVSDWGYIAALCDACCKDRKSYFKLPINRGECTRMEPRATERRDSAPSDDATVAQPAY